MKIYKIILLFITLLLGAREVLAIQEYPGIPTYKYTEFAHNYKQYPEFENVVGIVNGLTDIPDGYTAGTGVLISDRLFLTSFHLLTNGGIADLKDLTVIAHNNKIEKYIVLWMPDQPKPLLASDLAGLSEVDKKKLTIEHDYAVCKSDLILAYSEKPLKINYSALLHSDKVNLPKKSKGYFKGLGGGGKVGEKLSSGKRLRDGMGAAELNIDFQDSGVIHSYHKNRDGLDIPGRVQEQDSGGPLYVRDNKGRVIIVGLTQSLLFDEWADFTSPDLGYSMFTPIGPHLISILTTALKLAIQKNDYSIYFNLAVDIETLTEFLEKAIKNLELSQKEISDFICRLEKEASERIKHSPELKTWLEKHCSEYLSHTTNQEQSWIDYLYEKLLSSKDTQEL